MSDGEDSSTAGGQDGTVTATEQEQQRPPLTGRIYYLLGGTLPSTYRAWISHDLTGSGWRTRQAARPVLLMAPFAVIFALLPGAIAVRATVVAFLLVSGAGLGFATSGYFRNRRLEQHGFPPVLAVEDDDDE
ncbi:conserved hypothetical protein [Frankia canadensis]|uniref:Uncharacterized protein n=1 Tax=Frankia canadensis TaxID=1836972 RepID=A0A2I2KL56_9ACTN|nr:DUF5313 family protein [Frankia canadensis]SNQ46393.1 conserved hypothetical protein [Frankia canadensis]SOU53683.1 conserved hypothetical protein [Frankia canadensis]